MGMRNEIGQDKLQKDMTMSQSKVDICDMSSVLLAIGKLLLVVIRSLPISTTSKLFLLPLVLSFA